MLKVTTEKCQIILKGMIVILSVDLSATIGYRKTMENIFKILRIHNWETRILYLAKTSFKKKSKINTFSKFRTYRWSLKEILKTIFQ